jgi:hypothetical protein
MRAAVLLVSALAVATAIGAGSTAGLDVSVGPVGVSAGDGSVSAGASVGDTGASVDVGDDGVSVGVGIGDSSPDDPDEPDTPDEPDPDPDQPPSPDDPLPELPGDGGGLPDANDIPIEENALEAPDAQALPADETAVLTEQAETRRSRPSVESTLTHDGRTRVLAFAQQEDRLAALLALVTDCSLYTGVNELIDDRRITLVDLGDVLEQRFAVRLWSTLLFDPAGRYEALRTVYRNAELEAVLERDAITPDQVVALQVGASGMTEVFVLDDGDDPLARRYAVPWLRVFPWHLGSPWRRASILAQDCPVEDPITTASVRPREIFEPVTAEPQALPPPLPMEPEQAPVEPSQPTDAFAQPDTLPAGVEDLTASAAELGVLLDSMAVVDALLLGLDVEDRPGIVVADLQAGRTQGTGLVLSTHALAEALARIDGVTPELPVDDGRDILTASIPPDTRAQAIEEIAADQRLVDACNDFIDSLVEELDGLMAGLAASDDMYLVPIEGCVPSPDNGEAVSTMRSLLAADPRVRTRLAAGGYRPRDLVGASIDDTGRLSIFVVN